MNAWRRIPIVAALCLAAGAAPAAAQVGPIIDWISKLSGPGVMRFGLEASFPFDTGPRALGVSLAGMYGAKVKDGDPDPADGLSSWSGQATLDVPVWVITPSVVLVARGGLGLQSFTGDAFDSFTSFSFPLLATVRIGTGAVGALRLGGGVNVFKFPDDAFLPLDVGTEAGAWEVSLGFHASYVIDF